MRSRKGGVAPTKSASHFYTLCHLHPIPTAERKGVTSLREFPCHFTASSLQNASDRWLLSNSCFEHRYACIHQPTARSLARVLCPSMSTHFRQVPHWACLFRGSISGSGRLGSGGATALTSSPLPVTHLVFKGSGKDRLVRAQMPWLRILSSQYREFLRSSHRPFGHMSHQPSHRPSLFLLFQRGVYKSPSKAGCC